MNKTMYDVFKEEEADTAQTVAMINGCSAVATAPVIALEQAQGRTAAECVKFDLGMANRHGAMSLAYLARAGWRLANQKFTSGHGEWRKWCEENLPISYKQADNYIKFYNKTVTRWRESQGLANTMVAELTDNMIACATAGIDAQTATGAMIELGIVKRPANWGGARENAGRKSRNDAAAEAAELDEIANNPALLFAAAKGPLDELWKLHRERDLFARLGDEELAQVADVLADLSKAATAAHKLRLSGRARG